MCGSIYTRLCHSWFRSKHPRFVTKLIAYIDVGYGCWRQYVLVTTIRCWWRFWPFWSPSSTIFSHKRRAPSLIRCHQHPKIVANFKSLKRQCHPHHCLQIIIFETRFQGNAMMRMSLWWQNLNFDDIISRDISPEYFAHSRHQQRTVVNNVAIFYLDVFCLLLFLANIDETFTLKNLLPSLDWERN